MTRIEVRGPSITKSLKIHKLMGVVYYGSPVTDEYMAGTVFTGVIKKVVIDLAGERHIDPETESRIVMKRQ